MKDMIYNIFYDSSATITPMMTLQNMVITMVLGLIVCAVYRLTYSGVSYNQKFNSSLLMLSLITTMVMSILGSSLALSLGMVGALSIVRFRTAIKDPRDTAYIFWVIGIGLGAGSSNYSIVTIGTLMIAIGTFITMLFMRDNDTILVIVRGNPNCIDEVRTVIFGLYRACKLRSETIMEDYIEIVYQVSLKKASDVKKYEDIRKIEGVTFMSMVSRSGETLG